MQFLDSEKRQNFLTEIILLLSTFQVNMMAVQNPLLRRDVKRGAGKGGVLKPQILRPNLKTSTTAKKSSEKKTGGAGKKSADVVNLNCKFCEHVFNSEIALKIHQSLAHDDDDNAENENLQKIPKSSTGKFLK